MDSNVEIAAPVVGDIGSCVAALLEGMGGNWTKGPSDWMGAVTAKREENVAKMAPRLMNNNNADGLSRRARRAAHHRQGAARRDPGQRGRQHARPDARRDRHVQAAQAARRRHLGRDGHRHGPGDRRRGRDRQSGAGRSKATAPSASPAWRSRRSAATSLPVCIVVFNNDGIYRGTDVNKAGTDPATTVFVKGARYDKMMEAFGGVGVNATTPDELKRAVNAAMDSRQAHADQRGDRSGRRQRERPHRQSQSAIQAEEEVRGPRWRRRSRRRPRPRPRALQGEGEGQAGEEAGAQGRCQEAGSRSAQRCCAEDLEEAVGPGRQGARGREDPRLHARPVGPDLHPAAGVVRRRRDQGRAPGQGDITRGQLRRRARRRQPLFHDAEPQQALDHARLQEQGRHARCSSAW